jgi:hypothetical protein
MVTESGTALSISARTVSESSSRPSEKAV